MVCVGMDGDNALNDGFSRNSVRMNRQCFDCCLQFSIAFYQLCNMPEPDAEFSVFRHLTCVFLVLSSVWICHQAYVVVTTVCYLTTVAESFRFPFVSVIRKV